MRWQSVIDRGYRFPPKAVEVDASAAPEDLPEGPWVALLYENEEEREKLSQRLREAKLDELPWELIKVPSVPKTGLGLECMQHSLRRVTGVVGAGSVAVLAITDSRWSLAAALVFPLLGFFLVAQRFRRLKQLGMTEAI